MSQQDWTHILNWELKKGSHKFPGPAGGTCINEAAIVAAGFEYRAVSSYDDLPDCFCPVLGAFAIIVNDCLSKDERRRLLMPLVTRLAGSRDEEDWVERARAQFIVSELDRDVAAVAERCMTGEAARRWMRDTPLLVLNWNPANLLGERQPPQSPLDYVFKRLEAARSTVRRGDRPADGLVAYGGALVELTKVLHSFGPLRDLDPAYIHPPRWTSPICDETATYRLLGYQDVWPLAAQALTRAFRIGTQAPAADTAQVVERMEAIKAKAKERA